MKATILTYYQNLGAPQYVRVLDLWCKVWSGQGWNPVVLGIEDAKRHPRFNDVTRKASELPTVNSKTFELACYHRWLAFAMVGGIAADFDVFPQKPFPPTIFTEFTCGELGGSPGFVAGSKEDFDKIVDLILQYQTTPQDQSGCKPHVSDMVILLRNPTVFTKRLDLVRTYMQHGEWDKSPMVHFGNAHMKFRSTMDRADEIRKVLGL